MADRPHRADPSQPLSRGQEKQQAPPAPVTTAQAEEGSFTQPIRLTGTVEALASTALSSEVAGYIAELNVNEGDIVRQGQVLAQADQDRLSALQTGTRREDLAVAKAHLAKAQVTAKLAQKSHTRNRSLQKRNFVS